MDCIKGHTYRLDEFLLGTKSPEKVNPQDATPSIVDGIIQGAKDRGNKIMYLVIYLAPGDYHRYHSPAHFLANYRRHIPGYLEPVMPKYLAKHKDVLRDNERVNLLGEWAHGLFFMSFVGALNVGSIKLTFDDELRTNISSPKQPYMQDRNYATLQSSSNFLTFPVRNSQAKQGTEAGNVVASTENDDNEIFSVVKYLNEFDIKDMIDISQKETNFKYNVNKESTLKYNILNGFKDKEALSFLANNEVE